VLVREQEKEEKIEEALSKRVVVGVDMQPCTEAQQQNTRKKHRFVA